MKKLLIVVDYQRDFVCGSLGFAAAADLDDVISKKVIALRAEGGDIAFTMDGHKDNYAETQEGRKLPTPTAWRAARGGSSSAAPPPPGGPWIAAS